MSFYSDISEYYDSVFAVGPEEMVFTASLLNYRTPLLDIGCGTGNRTEYLCGTGNTVTGIDRDASMIDRARAFHARPCVQYETLDMMDIDKRFPGSSFEGILCLGNTLVHLSSPEEIAFFCRKVRTLLKDDGLFIVQILNYDYILERRVTSLPSLDSPEASFARQYKWREDGMHFVTALTVMETGQTIHGDTLLYPLTKNELSSCLGQAGFANMVFHGGYSGQPFTQDSFVLYVVCEAAT